jgi:hypothetical protein
MTAESTGPARSSKKASGDQREATPPEPAQPAQPPEVVVMTVPGKPVNKTSSVKQEAAPEQPRPGQAPWPERALTFGVPMGLALLLLACGWIIGLLTRPVEAQRSDATATAPSGQNHQGSSNKQSPPTETKATIVSDNRALDNRALEALQTQTNKLSGQVSALDDNVKNLSKQLAARPGNDPNATVEKTAQAVQGLIERKLEGRLENIKEGTARLEASVKGLEKQLLREAARVDVAVILYHTSRLDGNIALPAAANLVKQQSFQRQYPNYRLGMFVATDGSISAKLAPFTSGEKADQGFEKLSESKESTETPDKLEPEKLFGQDPAAPGQTGPRERRCVLVISSGATSPKSDAPNWKGLGVDVILLNPNPGKAPDRNILDGWERFCLEHNGLVVHLDVPKDKADPIFQKRLEFQLRRLTSPLAQ